MLITEESELNLAGDEMTWVVDSGASFHLTPDRKCFSSYTAAIMAVSGWGMKVHAEFLA